MRFGILGAGNIAHKFAQAVKLTGNETIAVAARDYVRAQAFADAEGIPTAYGGYEQMLDAAQIDCAYIATVPSTHYDLTMACLRRDIPVLCEKAMFNCESDAREAFGFANERGVFCMEALWSKFLPANIAAREWINSGRIGTPTMADFSIGFDATPRGDDSRYLSPKLCGGATTDITVYAYEILTWMLGGTPDGIKITALPYRTGVDAAENITFRLDDCVCGIRATLLSRIDERLEICGRRGSIVIPHPHYASEAFLYDANGDEAEHLTDDSPNGFVYEILEVERCISENLTQSATQRHSDTIECARLFDMIRKVCESNA